VTASKPPKPPRGLKTAGRRLWAAVLGDYDLDEHEIQLLEQACGTADLCARLAEAVDDGAPLVTADGRMRAELVELRQQRIVYARLLAALRVPLGSQEDDSSHDPEQRLQRRAGVRGVYSLHTGGRSS
jgi:hypothetical protein